MEPLTGPKGKEPSNLLFPTINHHSKGSKGADRSLYHSLDSGYVSSYNVTPYSTPNASSNLSSTTSTPQRFANSSNLITIPEISDGTKLTPVTQNIRKISDFHITTPKSQDFVAAGEKRTALYFEEYQSTPKKIKLETSVEDSATKSVDNTPRRLKKSHLRKKSFRYKLASAPEFEDVDSENIFSSQTNEISPIGVKSFRTEKRTPLAHANVNLQSSTPKSCGYRPKLIATDAREKANSVKKLLSFSDQQFQSLLDSEVKPSICEEGKADSLDLSLLDQPSPIGNFVSKSLVASGGSFAEDPTSSSCSGAIRKIYSLHEYKKFFPVFSVLKDREIAKRKVSEAGLADLNSIKNVKSTEKTSTIKSEDETSSKAIGFLDILKIAPSCTDMEISPLKPNVLQELCVERKGDFDTDGIDMEVSLLNQKVSQKSSHEEERNCDTGGNNYTIKTNYDIRVDRSIECEVTPLKPRRQSLEPNEQSANDFEELARLPRTPKKQKLHCLEQERAEILYPTIPHTPSKTLPILKVLHKKNFTEKKLERKPRKFYDGITYLNIISKLEPYTLVLEKIFELLSSQDLLNLTQTSRSCRRIVRSHKRANERLRSYLEACNLSKENNGEFKVYSVAKNSIKAKDVKGNETSSRAPFAPSNKNDRKRSLTILHSPPVSPSKRKFHENQKVVRTLKDNEKLTKCPRCSRSSRIIDSPLPQPGQSSHSSHFETFHSTLSTLHNISNASNSCDNNNAVSSSQPTFNVPKTIGSGRLLKSVSVDFGILQANTFYQRRLSSPFRPYAECSGLTCGFQFCLECLCDYHPGRPCKLYEPVSPSKEDLQNGILQLSSSVSRSRKSTNRRKSLKRLCF